MMHRFMRGVTLKVLHPILMLVGAFSKKNKESLQGLIIELNNKLVRMEKPKAKRILLLLPHCLQIDVCNRKLTTSVSNCARCGRCPVGELVGMGERYGLNVEVVNGGTLARKKVASILPDGIVAVACERDLTFGIQDVHPIPVYGVINDRPNGPCFNTCVDLKLVEDGIRFFRREPVTSAA